MTDLSSDEALTRAIHDAPWDLPVPAGLPHEVGQAVRTRRRRRTAFQVTAGAAAVTVIVAGVGIAAGQNWFGSDAKPPVLPSTASARPAPTRIHGSTTTVQVSGWVFDVPPGFKVEPRTSSSDARFGPDGLVNDRTALQDKDMAVHVVSRMMSADNSAHQIWITVLTPHPTKAFPGPRPAAKPTDAAAAARTIVDIESGKGVSAQQVKTLSRIHLGAARLVVFNPTNGMLFIQPAGSRVVLMLETAGTPMATMQAVAASGRR